jgi:predicted nuclease of predicted toxin-antitoxin system
MPTVALKLDENVPDVVLEILRVAGHDVALARDEQLAGVTDDTLLEAAMTEARALVTFDLDFSDIRRYDPSGTPGVIVLRLRNQSLPPVRRVAAALATLLSSEPLAGRLWIVTEDRLRIWPADVVEE